MKQKNHTRVRQFVLAMKSSRSLAWLQLVGEVAKMLSNGGDEVLNGVLEGGLEDIIEQIIKDVVASDVILELSNLSHDSFKEVNQKSFASLNMSLGLLNDILDSCINLLQDRLDSRGGLGNFSFNNGLDFVQKVENVVFHLSRLNLG